MFFVYTYYMVYYDRYRAKADGLASGETKTMRLDRSVRHWRLALMGFSVALK